MSLLQAFILGLIQGITEFLPISSSAHMQLVQYFFQFNIEKESILFFTVFCNLGTTCSIITVFNKDIRKILIKYKEINFYFIIPSLPLIPIALLRSRIIGLFAPQYFGFYFLITAAALYSAQRCAGFLQNHSLLKKRAYQAFWIGSWQAITVFPGISRSGITIVAARWIGWDFASAVRYCFLLAIPTSIGATILESIALLRRDLCSAVCLHGSDIVGFVTSFAIGWLMLSFVLKIAQRKNISLLPFALYCLMLGAGLIFYFYMPIL